MRAMIVIFYKHPDDESTVGIPEPEVPPTDVRRVPGDEPAYCVSGAGWEECMQAYYDIEEYGTYVPVP